MEQTRSNGGRSRGYFARIAKHVCATSDDAYGPIRKENVVKLAIAARFELFPINWKFKSLLVSMGRQPANSTRALRLESRTESKIGMLVSSLLMRIAKFAVCVLDVVKTVTSRAGGDLGSFGRLPATENKYLDRS